MRVELDYSKSSLKFLDQNSALLSRDESDKLVIKAIKKIYKISIESIDVKKLKGDDALFRIRKGDIRIVFSSDRDGKIIIAFINEIDFRGNIYKK